MLEDFKWRFVVEPVDKEDAVPSGSWPWSFWVLPGLSIVGLALQTVYALDLHLGFVATGLWASTVLCLGLRPPRTTAISLATIFAIILAIQLSLLLVYWEQCTSLRSRATGIASSVCSILCLALEVNLPFRDPKLPSDDIGKRIPDKHFRSPEDNFTLLQWMTVAWVKPLVDLGYKRQLNDEDVWFLPYEFQHRHLHDAFTALSGSVVMRIIKANWMDLVVITSLSVLELTCDYSSPVILQYLLRAMEQISTNKRPAIAFATIMLLVRSADAQVETTMLWFQRRCYERSRGEMITMIHEKTLNRKIIGEKPGDANTTANGHASNGNNGSAPPTDQNDGSPDETTSLLYSSSKKKTPGLLQRFQQRLSNIYKMTKISKAERKQPASIGRLLNIIRSDVYEVAQRFWDFDKLVQQPLGLIISFVLVWRLLGWACLFGVAVVLLTQGLNALGARINIMIERRRRSITDDKLKRISQYVEAIRHLRWYGWEQSWLEKIMEVRENELRWRLINMCCNIYIGVVNRFGSGMLPVAAFYAYTALAGKQLSVDVAFPALQLFSMLQKSLQALPDLITTLVNAKVAIDRIEDFMAEPNKLETFGGEDVQLQLQNATFAWPGTSRYVLRNLTLSLGEGLNLVVGVVGAGKSALLQALLGELDLESGHLIRSGNTPVAYCSQTPWLQSMTIRDNILFTEPFDEIRYRKVLDACALLPDLATFQHGDLSPIGENGIGLSGGQKARVALARAVYSRANVLLLDDPISALDQQTAEHIVKHCLTGSLMEGRAVVLVTHRTDLCRGIAVQTIELSHGAARVYSGNTEQAEVDLLPTVSIASQADEQAKILEKTAISGKFEEEERRAHGGVLASVYWEYIKAGQFKWWFGMILFAAMVQVTMTTQSWFLKEWSEAYERDKAYASLVHQSLTVNDITMQETPLSGFFNKLPNPTTNVYAWLRVYVALVSVEAVAVFFSSGFTTLLMLSAARRMFREVMTKISNAPFRYYDVVPVGRLMNRLTSDITTVDGPISARFMIVAWQILAWVTSILVFASITPQFLIFSTILTGMFVWIFLKFLPASQSLRRLEMVSLSPMMSNFGALLSGLTTVRAFCLQSAFLSQAIDVTDTFQKMDHFYWSVQAWLGYRFDLLSSISSFLLTVLAIYSNLTPGLTAFVLVSAQRFVQATHGLCRSYGALQLDFVSVERVVELLHLTQEDAGDIEPPASWPKYGSTIEIQDLTIQYTPAAPLAISDVSATFPGGTHTALVGRTGSGKSTLSLAMLATTPPIAGRILIDGVDINRVNKQTLRQRVTFLAQEPVLFPGTLRHNLDPQEEYTDEECQQALASACGDQNFGIETEITAHGANLSQGQRQLISLARALLRKSSVVIMDEATASVDMATAERVYKVVQEELQSRGSTVVSVAHRAAAMDGVDGILTLDKGKVVEVSGSVVWTQGT